MGEPDRALGILIQSAWNGISGQVPPHIHVKLRVTIDEKVMARLKVVHEQELKRAEDEDRTEPDWSNTVEMTIRKGIKAYLQARKHRIGLCQLLMRRVNMPNSNGIAC